MMGMGGGNGISDGQFSDKVNLRTRSDGQRNDGLLMRRRESPPRSGCQI
jgi:hypothetical protein